MAAYSATPATRPIIYALAATADVDAQWAEIALVQGIESVVDPLIHARLEVAARAIGVHYPIPSARPRRILARPKVR